MSARWVGDPGLGHSGQPDWAGTVIALDKGSTEPVDLAAVLDEIKDVVPLFQPRATRVRVNFARPLEGGKLFAAATVIDRG